RPARFGTDGWAPSVPEQCGGCDRAGAGLVKARGFRSARVYRRDRQSWGDVAEGMRVAYCEIVQPSLDACIPANREVRLVALNIKRTAVDATDTEPFVAKFP